ncbi:MAG TPA: helix-turn-helix domain-containing protein [Solirubrobacterales bacterium]|nr:helix-turn-helix domain-containing protein [Solirubrobacterales bacterium]
MADRHGSAEQQATVELLTLVEAMTHRDRGRVLAVVAERDQITVGEIAVRLGEPQRKVRYHLGKLIEAGLVRVAGERGRRGAIERWYRATRLPYIHTEQSRRLSPEQMRRIALEVLKLTLADAKAAMEAGGFGIGGDSQARVSMEVDSQGLDELHEIYRRALAEVMEVRSASRERIIASQEEPKRMVAALFLFRQQWPGHSA